MSLKSRLILGVATILLVFFAGSSITLMELQIMKTESDHLTHVIMPSTEAFDELGDVAQELRLNMTLYVFTGNAEHVDQLQQNMILFNESMEEALNKAQDSSERFEALSTEIRGKVEALQKSVNVIITNPDSSLTEETKESYTALVNDLKEVTHQLFDYEYTHALGDISLINRLTKESAFSLTAGLVLGLIVGVIGIILIVRNTLAMLGADPIALTNLTDRQAQGFLDVENAAFSKGVAASVQSVTQKLREVVGLVKNSTKDLGQSVDVMNSSVSQLHQATKTQAEKMSMIATASVEMTQTAQDIAANVNTIKSEADDSLRQAQEGGNKVERSVGVMSDIVKKIHSANDQVTTLETKADEVQNVVSMIRGIAEQTNLLALNAAIEAARAGDVGRGFAVVADEVRNLAERSAQSTEEISSIMQSINDSVKTVLDSMGQVSEMADKGNEQSQDVKHAFDVIISRVESLQNRLTDNSAAIEEMSVVSEQITQDIEAVAALSEESAASGDSIADAVLGLNKNAQQLGDNISFFKIQ